MKFTILPKQASRKSTNWICRLLTTITAASFIFYLFSHTPANCGQYVIGKDSGGMYFQADQDGGWQIPKEDQKLFKVGERGTYTKGRDGDGTYIKFDDGRKFYLDVRAKGTSSNFAPDSGQQQEAKASGKETKVTVKGNQVLVPVALGYGGKEVQVSLLLDTGATITTLNRTF